MSAKIIDSSVVAKWILPESDSAKAKQLITDALSTGDKLVVLDLVFPEVANAIWKRQRQQVITPLEASQFLDALNKLPVHIEPAYPLIPKAFSIAVKYDRAIYDALFVALALEQKAIGVTADEPLYNSTRTDFPNIVLL